MEDSCRSGTGGKAQGEVHFHVYLPKHHEISAIRYMRKNLGGTSALPNVLGNVAEVGETGVYPGRLIFGSFRGLAPKFEKQREDTGGEVVSSCQLSL